MRSDPAQLERRDLNLGCATPIDAARLRRTRAPGDWLGARDHRDAGAQRGRRPGGHRLVRRAGAQGETEGDLGDQQMGLQARLMSQALRKLTAMVSRNGATVVFINQIRLAPEFLEKVFPPTFRPGSGTIVDSVAQQSGPG